MTQLCRLKVKVTVQGHGLNPCFCCPLHISGTIFIKLHPNVNLSDAMKRTHDSATQTLGQGHSSRSWDKKSWILFPLHISWNLWTVLIKLHSNYPLSEFHVSAMQTQHEKKSHFKVMRLCCRGFGCPSDSMVSCSNWSLLYPQKLFVGVYCFHLVRPLCLSVTFCFLNIFKSFLEFHQTMQTYSYLQDKYF